MFLDNLKLLLDQCVHCKPHPAQLTFHCMLLKTRGIVLRKIPYSETSIIADIYTETDGKMSCIISGVRKPRARISASMLEVMSVVEMVVYASEKSTLNRIRELKPAYTFRTIPFDVRKGAILLFMGEICSKTIREEEPNEELFACILKYLVRLDEATGGFGNLHLFFLVELADLLGFGPDTNYSRQNNIFDFMGGRFTSQVPNHNYHTTDAAKLATMVRIARGSDEELSLSRSDRNQLVDQLVLFFRLHIETLKDVKSHIVLREIL